MSQPKDEQTAMEGVQSYKEDLQIEVQEKAEQEVSMFSLASKEAELRVPSQKGEKPVLVSKQPADTKQPLEEKEEDDKYWLRGMRQQLQHVRSPSDRKRSHRLLPSKGLDEETNSTAHADADI